MKSHIATLLMSILAMSASAQTNLVVPLWPGEPPGSLGVGEGHSPP